MIGSREELVVILFFTALALIAVGSKFPEVSYAIASITIVWAISDPFVNAFVLKKSKRLSIVYVSYFVGIVIGSLLSQVYTDYLIMPIVRNIPSTSTSPSTPTPLIVSSLIAALAVLISFNARFVIKENKDQKGTEDQGINEVER